MRLGPHAKELIDRSERLTFTYAGRTIEAFRGDTIGSALFAAGERVFTRSFKYHRPRGLYCCSGGCASCLMQVDGVPNVRTCVHPVRGGEEGHAQITRGTLARDQPLVFPGNDRPGVMTPEGVRRLVQDFRLAPGKAAVVVAPGAGAIAELLRADGIAVAAEVDLATRPLPRLAAKARGAALAGVMLDGRAVVCDLLVASAGRQPAYS